MQRRPDLDGLRGIAVLVVVLYHWNAPVFRKGGWIGVEIFFVLSGYLITSILLRESTGKGRISLKRFWARRILRLFPALLVFAVTVTVIGALILPKSEFSPAVAFPAAMLYVSNWLRALGLNGGDRKLGPLSHTWSLAIEEQFYLVWPPVVILLLRLRKATALQATGILAIGALLFRIAISAATSESSLVYYSSFTRAGGLLLGCALAAAESEGRLRPRAWMQPAALVSLVVLAGCVATFANGSMLALGIGMTVADVACLLVLLALCTDAAPALSRVLGWPPLAAVGLVSYGIYLWHKGLWVLFSTGHDMTAARYVVLATTTVAAVLASWFLVEKPFLARKRRYEVPAAPHADTHAG